MATEIYYKNRYSDGICTQISATCYSLLASGLSTSSWIKAFELFSWQKNILHCTFSGESYTAAFSVAITYNHFQELSYMLFIPIVSLGSINFTPFTFPLLIWWHTQKL